jgi:hypothetical protein
VDISVISDWCPMTGVCDWSNWSADIGSKIISLLHTSISQLMENNKYRVACGIEVENWTKWSFIKPVTTLQSGYLSCSATTVLPATREVMVCYTCSIFHFMFRWRLFDL